MPTGLMRTGRTWVAGAVLLVLAALLWVAHLHASGTGVHSWDANDQPPAFVHLTSGREYALSGSRFAPQAALRSTGVAAAAVASLSAGASLTCTYTAGNGASGAIDLAATGSDSRDLHVLGTFRASVTGRVSVRCDEVARVFVDNADDAPVDESGWLVLLTIVVGLAGALTVVSALASRDRVRWSF